jgi:DNA helicase-2/ATP-dependent DNA helicase PcrA
LIVDEYQDTNVAQLEMLRLLAAGHNNLCVVGDDDQAIYAWRGADVRNILDFDKHFSGTKIVKLERNYRSTEAVLSVANAVLASSQAKRHEKKLIPTQGAGDKVKIVTAIDGSVEARFVAEEACRIIERGGRPKDIAVLYRSNLQAPEIEAEMKARAVPYQLFGGAQTFERKEVKDLLAYVEVAVNPYAELAVRRSINYPSRAIGDAALAKLAVHATLHDTSLYHAAERAHAVAGLSDRAREGCRDWVRVVTELRRAVETCGTAGGGTIVEAVKQLADNIELRRNIFAECGENNKAAGRRWTNVLYLLKAFERRDQKERLDRAGVEQFLRVLMLRQEEDEDGAVPDKVTLTTMHGAKGLEFPYVFVIGLEEGFLPHARSLEERVTDGPQVHGGPSVDELEQERRLFYVAITRAKQQLYLCHARGRATRGKTHKRVPSRFLLQIPEDLLEPVDLLDPPKPDVAAVKRGAEDVLAAILGASR